MPGQYIGGLKGFQVYTNMRDPITLKNVTANDLVNILNNFDDYYKLKLFMEAVEDIEQHAEVVGVNVHNIHLLTLGLEILVELYNNWIALGNEDTLENFALSLFTFLQNANTDSELLSNSSTLILTVKKYYRMLHLFHTGIVYAHPPILDYIKTGTVVSTIPFISLENVTGAITRLYPSETENIYAAEALDYISTYLAENVELDGQVMFFKYLHEIIRQGSSLIEDDIKKLSYILEVLYPSWRGVFNGTDVLAIAKFVSVGTVVGNMSDPEVLNVKFEYGTWRIKIELTPIIAPIYYLTIFRTLETNWTGFSSLTPPSVAELSDPGIAVFRHPDDPTNIYIRFSSDDKINQIAIPVSDHTTIAFSYDGSTVKYGYISNDGYVFQDIIRNPFSFNGQRVTITNVLNIQYYLNQTNESQLTYLLT